MACLLTEPQTPGWWLLHGPWTCAWSGALPLESAGPAFSGYSTKWQPCDISQLLWLTLSLQSKDLEKLVYSNQSLSNSNFALAKTLRWHKTTLAYTPNWMGCWQPQTPSLPPPNLQTRPHLSPGFPPLPRGQWNSLPSLLMIKLCSCPLDSSFLPPHKSLPIDHPCSLLCLQPLSLTGSFSSAFTRSRSIFRLGKHTEWMDCVINVGWGGSSCCSSCVSCIEEGAGPSGGCRAISRLLFDWTFWDLPSALAPDLSLVDKHLAALERPLVPPVCNAAPLWPLSSCCWTEWMGTEAASCGPSTGTFP